MIQLARVWRLRWTWTLTSLSIAAFATIPLIEICRHIGRDSDGTWQHLTETVLAGYIYNTTVLAVGVSIGSLLMGVCTAWLVTMCQFPGRQVLQFALLLPLAIPTYLLAYAATDLLQFSGPVQTLIRETFHWTKEDYWFPNIRSLSGAITILSLGLYPYVYLASRTAFLEQSACVLEVSRTLGVGPWSSFLRVALPLARPSIVAGLSLTVMETLAEFGAVDYCAVDTFATGIYRTWMSLGSLTAAAQLSACLLGAILLLLIIESAARSKLRFHHATYRYRELTLFKLRPPMALLTLLFCCAPVLFGFVFPVTLFMLKSFRNGDERAREIFLELGQNSLIVAALAGLVATFLALITAYCRRIQPTPAVKVATRLSGLGYAIPGGVIAIGLFGPLSWIEENIDKGADELFGWSPGFWLTGTMVALIIGYQTRFLAVALSMIQAGLTRIQSTLDDASYVLGRSPGRTLGQVHFPLLRGSLLCAALLVFVDTLKELPITLILRPFNFETLAVRVYQLASAERLDEASSGALAIIMTGLIPVIILSRLMSVSRPSLNRTNKPLP